MAKYGKNNYFNGAILPEPKEEMLRRMAKGVNTTRGYLYARSIDIDKYNGDRSFQVAFTTGDDITTTQYIRTNYPLGLVISNDRMCVSMWGQWLLGYDVQSNTEYDVVVSFDVTTRASTLYVNGQLIATRLREDVAPNYSKTYFLGAYPEQTNLFTGDIALCREFNFQIPKAVVALLHNNGDPSGYVLPGTMKDLTPVEIVGENSHTWTGVDDPVSFNIKINRVLSVGGVFRITGSVSNYKSGTPYLNLGNSSIAYLPKDNSPFTLVVTLKKGSSTLLPYIYIYGGSSSEDRQLTITVDSIESVGCVAEYLPQNLIPTAEGSVVQWLDSAPQLPEANGILPPLDASVGGYDLAAIGNPKIII